MLVSMPPLCPNEREQSVGHIAGMLLLTLTKLFRHWAPGPFH